MNTLEDTMATLQPSAREMAKMVMDACDEWFAKEGKIAPGVFAIPFSGEDVVCQEIPVIDEKTKPVVWAAIRALRRTNPVVGFASEVWMAHCGPENLNPDGSVKVMPRDDPNRKEKVALAIWQGTRHVMIFADIERNPDGLGEWKVIFDSHFKTKNAHTEVGGALAAGDPHPIEEN